MHIHIYAFIHTLIHTFMHTYTHAYTLIYEGDHIFGIMPVKAALTSRRGRVITELLVQQGMDISNKKDEKAVRDLLCMFMNNHMCIYVFICTI